MYACLLLSQDGGQVKVIVSFSQYSEAEREFPILFHWHFLLAFNSWTSLRCSNLSSRHLHNYLLLLPLLQSSLFSSSSSPCSFKTLLYIISEAVISSPTTCRYLPSPPSVCCGIQNIHYHTLSYTRKDYLTIKFSDERSV